MKQETDTNAASRSDLAESDRLKGMVLVSISSFGISFGGLVSRYIEDADAWQINIHRSLATVLVVLVVFLYRYRSKAASQFVRIGRPGLVGAVMLTIAGIAFMQSITTTTVANTLFTLSSIPFITAALAWIFLRESLSKVTLVTMVVAAAGVGIMVTDGVGEGSALRKCYGLDHGGRIFGLRCDHTSEPTC